MIFLELYERPSLLGTLLPGLSKPKRIFVNLDHISSFAPIRDGASIILEGSGIIFVRETVEQLEAMIRKEIA